MTSKKNSKSFVDALIDGLSGYEIDVQSRQVERSNPSNDLEKMRGDWRKIGNDFNVSIEKSRQSASQ